jgi:hypothetical protein
MSKHVLFQERQTLGSVRFWTTRRFILALFCFAAYFVSEERDRQQDADLFLVVGLGIVLISILFIFLTHYRTVIEDRNLILTGLWSTKKVKIDLGNIVATEIVKYSPFMINNPVYNLHKKGTIRFYAYGKYAVQLTDKDGLIYLIGSQDPIEFNNVVSGVIKRS